jgi:anti-sigma regulatory factor (Ser/Thr protein kinase)
MPDNRRRRRESFSPRPSSVPAVRHFVEDALQDWGVTSEASLLVATELASNAVVHACTEFTVLVRLRPGGVAIEVSDGDARVPSPAQGPTTAEEGRGLRIVDGLTDDWGVRSSSFGKTVWGDVPTEVGSD